MDKKTKNKKIKLASPTSPHVALGIALFLIGGELFWIGISDQNDAYASGLAFVLACLISMAAAPAAGAIFGVKSLKSEASLSHRIAFFAFGVVACAVALWVALTSAVELVDFALNVMLMDLPRAAVFLIFLAFCLFLAQKGVRTVKKFVLIAFSLSGALTVILFLMSIPLFDLENLSGFFGGTADAVRVAEIFVSRFAPIGMAIVYFGFDGGGAIFSKFFNKGAPGVVEDLAENCDATSLHNTSAPLNESDGVTDCHIEQSSACEITEKHPLTPLSAISGVLIGGAFLLISYFNVALLLGTDMARGEEYPYSVAVSAISAGKLFMRMEAFSYAIYFLTVATRTAIAIGTLREFFVRALSIKRAE